jgi:FkbM family methyltransferase
MLIPYSNCCEIIKATHGSVPLNILHIGAHTGEEAAAYQENSAEQVIWFEANQTLIPQLQSHLKQFTLKQQIAPLALWEEDCELVFKVTNNFQSSSFFDLKSHSDHYPQIKVTEEKKIKAYRADKLFSRSGANWLFSDFQFINIDTQGAELAILKGMGSFMWQESVKAIYLEINREELYAGIPLVAELDDFLARHSFLRVKTKWTGQGWGDALYLRSSES